MDDDLRRALPTRIVACSFIVLILLGNFWLTCRIIGATVPTWFSHFAMGGFVGVAVGAAGMLVHVLARRFG